MIHTDGGGLTSEFVAVCHQLHRSGLVAATDGNISCRRSDGLLFITPSGVPKRDLGADDILTVDLHGIVLEGKRKPSSEIRMHLMVYNRRPDVQAVVHAHPPMLTALTLANIAFQSDSLPEVWLGIGPVPTAPYATPSTDEVPQSIAPFVESHDAMLLERHGSLTLGRSLHEAYMRLEKLEHAAHVFFYAYLLRHGMPTPLSHEALTKLRMLREVQT